MLVLREVLLEPRRRIDQTVPGGRLHQRNDEQVHITVQIGRNPIKNSTSFCIRYDRI